jgi:hypothetical protein
VRARLRIETTAALPLQAARIAVRARRCVRDILMEKFFIVGCPRSGTTMVQQALNRHSDVAIPPETKFFFSFFGHSRRCQLRHIERLNEDLGVALPRPHAAVRSVAEGRAFYEVLARQYVARLQKPGVTHFGEKTPEHTGQLPRIRQLFPSAKIVVLTRDGRDVASSLTRMPWMPAGLYVNFLVWLYYHRLIRKAKAEGCPNLYFARYEEIVADPEKQFAGILEFLGLPYESAVAAGYGNREGIPQREYGWKERALRKITRDRVGVFQRELTGEQVATLERLGGSALRSLGYPLLTDGRAPLSLGFLLRLGWDAAAFVARLPWHSVVNELLGRAFLCGGQESSVKSQEPAAREAVPAGALRACVSTLGSWLLALGS